MVINYDIKKINNIGKCIDTLEKIVVNDEISLDLLNKRIDKIVCTFIL